jgi:hypothetical protein
MEGFYLQPAELCADKNAAFAAGVLVLTCIDALARIQIGGGVGQRFRQFAARELSSFRSGDKATRLYDDFRHGLVHEARIKRGAQFLLQFDETIVELDRVLLINPRRLVSEVRKALGRQEVRTTHEAVQPRLLRLRDAPRYLGMYKNRFNREVRPWVTVIPIHGSTSTNVETDILQLTWKEHGHGNPQNSKTRRAAGDLAYQQSLPTSAHLLEQFNE